MHPQCWVMYMTHSAGGSRHGVGAHGRLHVQCPTCRRAVTGDRDHEHSPSGARVALSVGGEQFERLIVLGSEPGDPPVYIPRVPRIAFPEWEWGWWNTGTWQSGSSGSGWWDRPERDDDEDDAWSRWNRGRRAPRTGGYGGYGGADRQIPEDCPHRCGARAPSYQGGVDRGAYADPPNPAHPEFRGPASWQRWVRGAFVTYRKTGDAKYRVKMERANINMKARGVDPDCNTGGGRSAAMDPGTARTGGQKRQGRSGDDDDDRPVARGGAAASTADWWPAESLEEGLGAGIEDRNDEATPVDDHGTAEPDPHAGEHPPADPGASPLGFASGATGTDADSGTVPHAAGAEGAQGRPSVLDGSVVADAQAAGAAEIAEGEAGQVGQIFGFLSHHGSPGPVVPSHCAGDTTAIGGARPGSSSDCGGSAGLAPPHPRRQPRGPR